MPTTWRRTLSLCIVLPALTFAACAGNSSTQPTAPTPFSGTWSGIPSGNTGPFGLTLTLSQSGSSVSGTSVWTFVNPIAIANLTLKGTATGSSSTLTVTDPSNGSTVGSPLALTISGSTMSVSAGAISGSLNQQTGIAGCANPAVGTLNIQNTYAAEQHSNMYLMLFTGTGAVVAQGTNQIVQDVLSGPYILKTFGTAADGKIYTDDSWNLCTQSFIQVDACKVNQYKSNTGCSGRPLPHG